MRRIIAGKLLWCLLAVFLVGSSLSEASKILVIFPFPSKSHSILGDAVTDILTAAGHEVWYMTVFPRKDTHLNLHQVEISENKALSLDDTIAIELQARLNKKKSTMGIETLPNKLYSLVNTTFTNKNVIRMIEDPKLEFDLVVIEWMFSELYTGFAALYECPYIWFSSLDPHSMVTALIDEALNPAYNPGSLSPYSPPFTFIQRVESLISHVFITFFKYFVLSKLDNNMYNDIYGPYMEQKGKTLPSLDELKYNASLMLGNSHVSTGKAFRLPQNYKPIGGYHIDPTVKPLPEDLKKIIENAQNGVIYFSLGSNIKSKDLPETIKKNLVKVFGRLIKYTVLWKFEEDLQDLPPNVHILKWAPQTSILAHPNCKLFITHGGLLSTTETIHYGKPIIGIPVFADQFNNVNKAVSMGFAIRVDMSYSLAEELKVAIEEILSNPKYTAKVKELSLIYHDRPVSPRKELVHWVEHVIKTGGAPHLRSPALLVPWYQKMYLDLLGLLVALYYLLKFTIKRSLSLRKKKKVDSKKKN